jgi:AraC family transcriptional regulator
LRRHHRSSEKNPHWQNWSEQYPVLSRERSKSMQVNIVDFKETAIAALEHRGDLRLLNDVVKRFIEWRKESGLSPITTSRSFGIPYKNPDVVAPELFRFDVCGEVQKPVPENRQGVVNKIIPGGRCAVTRHFGSRDRIGESIYPLYREWLPTSGEELRDFPLFFHYINLAPDELEQDMETDIYLPLR